MAAVNMEELVSFYHIMSVSVCLTCREGSKDDSVVEWLRCAVVVLQKHPVRTVGFSRVKYRLHLQQLKRARERERDGDNSWCPEAVDLKHKVSSMTDCENQSDCSQTE